MQEVEAQMQEEELPEDDIHCVLHAHMQIFVYAQHVEIAQRSTLFTSHHMTWSYHDMTCSSCDLLFQLFVDSQRKLQEETILLQQEHPEDIDA